MEIDAQVHYPIEEFRRAAGMAPVAIATSGALLVGKTRT
jgi:hypothetical protein